MLDESDAVRKWRDLFQGRPVTPKSLADAEALVDKMHPESPLRLRLATELVEIRDVFRGQNPGRKSQE
jgi:hypothetical protein